MVSRKIRQVPREQAFSYLAKAQEFLAVAELALADGRCDASGLNSVQSTISAADAVTAFRGGMRSVEQDHRVARDVLEDTVGADAKPALRHLTAVLAKENHKRAPTTVQYVLPLSPDVSFSPCVYTLGVMQHRDMKPYYFRTCFTSLGI